MIRNTVLYHRFWYVKKRNAFRTRVFFRLCAIMAILAIIVSFASRIVLPGIFSVLDLKARTIVEDCVNQAFYESLADGNTSGLTGDAAELNRLSGRVGSSVAEMLEEKSGEIAVPVGAFLGTETLSGIGPRMKATLISEGQVKTEIRSEISDTGGGNLRHAVYLLVSTRVTISVESLNWPVEIVTCIPLSDMVITGSIPSTLVKHLF